MSTTTKSPKLVALEALAVGEASFSPYSHPFSQHAYTQAQLFACLILKAFLGVDYRGMEAYLHDSKEMCLTLKLSRVPHYTTLQKACERLLKQNRIADLLQVTVRRHVEFQKKHSSV